ncbi:PREDICTED: nodulin-related protein 1-like [Nelumbo nucifera]|uniref:Nodulin-related protein 1-like n=2 Tax=Nelumbo nucifera TaxID=4432 RepID=A0A1U8A9E6_NELNU|nr:PREDICTED: nodulin-related protein 1-like [Nelumbo nucifera]DAD31386.1 TPA_asm: hypothetical protein HUJ06_010237 [Nelumbo nucifera]
MDSTPHHNQKHQPSKAEILSSAKVVAEAAKATVHHETDKVDKGKVAGAAADLLGAASHYGKLEEKGMGKYVDKAENYLHQYHSSHSTSAPNSTHSTTTTHSSTHSHSGGDSHSESGYGEYIKMAQGFLKKH